MNRRRICPDPARIADGRHGAAASRTADRIGTGWRHMKHATSRELYGYWNRVRGGEAAPRREATIEPSDIRRILADTFILEVVDRESYPSGWPERGSARSTAARSRAPTSSTSGRTTTARRWRRLPPPSPSDAAAAVRDDRGRAPRATRRVAVRDPAPAAAPRRARPTTASSAAAPRSSGPIGSAPSRSSRQTLTSLRLIWPDERPHFLRRASDRAATALAPIALPAGDGGGAATSRSSTAARD